MDGNRAKRIVKALGWKQVDLVRRYNRTARARADAPSINRQLNGTRPVSDALATFLRMSVRVAVLERQLARLTHSS